MAWLSLCDKDPLLSLMQEMFHAHPIRVPEERYRPLTAIGVAGRKTHFIGGIEGLLAGKPNLSDSIMIADGAVANLKIKKTTAIKITLGVQVLEGFLQTFNVPAGVDTAFRGAKTASFSFGNVRRAFIDAPVLGQVLKNHKLDRSNPINGRMLKGEQQLHIIDSVITSNEFSISVEGSQDVDFRIDVPLIQELLSQARADISVQSTSSSTVSFVGEKRLAFAFSCLRFYLDGKDRIRSLDPNEAQVMLGEDDESTLQSRRIIPSPARVLLHDDSGLFSFDDDSPR